MEELIAAEITSFIEHKNILPHSQHVFRKARSVTTQLLEVVDDLSSASEEKFPVDIIYFDLAKAFDSIPHDRLVRKLESVGIKGPLLKWI